MPRKARVDLRGALHHIIIRGIERKPIFKDKIDYGDFIDRLSKILVDTGTACFVWALINNHALCGAPHNNYILYSMAKIGIAVSLSPASKKVMLYIKVIKYLSNGLINNVIYGLWLMIKRWYRG